MATYFGIKGLDTLDLIQLVLVVLLSIFIANYLYIRWTLKGNREAEIELGNMEGFANQVDSDNPEGDVIVLGNEHLFDEFYAKVYDIVVDGDKRQNAEVNLALTWARSFRPENNTIEVLDIGCGTGGDVEVFRTIGVKKVVGIDASDAMITEARKKHPKSDYRVGEIEQIGNFAAGEFNLATMFYFTYYYLRDPDMMFRNVFSWLQPGGCLAIHLVNREKFDPVLEAANPFVAFSVQKYSKERVTRSKVTFDKFTYEADFSLEGSTADFREEFKFKNGKMRRQTHKLRMPKMDEVISKAEANGFVYKQFIDLTAIGYEYQYLFCFVR
jgi:SAM-dependent methyltransferase